MANKLVSPLVTVIRENGAEPLMIQTSNQDLVLWDRTRNRHKWPGFQDAPFLWLTFISWAAARRQGLIAPELTYEQWEATVIDVNADDKAPDVNPTVAAAEPD